MSLIERLAQAGRRAGRRAVDAALRQPEVKRRVDAARVVLKEAREAFEERFDDAEADLWAWIQKVQAHAEKAHRQAVRARDADHYYAVLGLKSDATLAQVKTAWRKQMRATHPDRFAHDPAAEAAAHTRALEVNEAYRELTALLSGRESRRSDRP